MNKWIFKFERKWQDFTFKTPATTSRGSYKNKTSYLVELRSVEHPELKPGIGECAPLPGLSPDWKLPGDDDFLLRMKRFLELTSATGKACFDIMRPWPAIYFAIETALRSFETQSDVLYPTPFTRGRVGIPFNGLVWMGSYEEMKKGLEAKLDKGFRCVKLKIGAISFDDEMRLVKEVRSRFPEDVVQLRVDANGAFSPDEALRNMETLARYGVHSIEQPVKQGQWKEMARVCREGAIPVALDEELIRVWFEKDKKEMLDEVKPQYLVLKPTLHGGYAGVKEWDRLARERGIKTWVTSALESNIGLNAVAQIAADMYGPDITFPQGLGTGQLYERNEECRLWLKGDEMWFDAYRFRMYDEF